MSRREKSIDDNLPSAYITLNPFENLNEISNITNCQNSTLSSTISNESDLSLLSLSMDKELESAVDVDELPVFEIRLISPLGRTPSPIDSEDIQSPIKRPLAMLERFTPSPCRNNPEYVALHDINAQISPPSDGGEEVEPSLSRTNSLETIFEGVFLNTPPRKRLNIQDNRLNRSRTNILERVAVNRVNIGKENQSPLSNNRTSPSRDYNGIKDPSAICGKRNIY